MIDSFVSRVVEAVTNPEASKEASKMAIGKVSDVVSKDPIKAEPPLLEYEKLRGKPYTAEYLDIDWNKKNPIIFEKNHKDVSKIEKYVIDDIKRRNWEPTLKSYKDVMSSIKSAVNIEDNTDKNNALERIMIYVDAMDKKHKYEKKIKDALDSIHESIKD